MDAVHDLGFGLSDFISVREKRNAAGRDSEGTGNVPDCIPGQNVTSVMRMIVCMQREGECYAGFEFAGQLQCTVGGAMRDMAGMSVDRMRVVRTICDAVISDMLCAKSMRAQAF